MQPHAIDVAFDGPTMYIDLSDGRAIQLPLRLFPVLDEASSEQREHLAISLDGQQLFWPELDEDMSVTALLNAAARKTMH
ncbi:DUF2442 domain-containing protein [Paraburkholderia sp. A2RI-6]|uniref:DUF2442 domain-containing protein n=1 Tax=Paraburkholderia sp. A2RI-6 TaxID=3028371 RepID=UPI003B77B210